MGVKEELTALMYFNMKNMCAARYYPDRDLTDAFECISLYKEESLYKKLSGSYEWFRSYIRYKYDVSAKQFYTDEFLNKLLQRSDTTFVMQELMAAIDYAVNNGFFIHFNAKSGIHVVVVNKLSKENLLHVLNKYQKE